MTQPDTTDRLAPLPSLKVVALDVETTGLDPQRDRVVSLAVATPGEPNGEPRVLLDVTVNPGVPIPARATSIHGIGDDHVRGAQSLAAHLPQLRKIVAGSVVIGHHVEFDMAVLAAEAARARVDWTPPPWLCTAALAQAVLPGLGRYDLDAVAEALKVPIVGRHTASGDAVAAATIWQSMVPLLEQRGIRTLGAARAAARPRDATEPSVGEGAMRRLESFPYRHRLADVMSSPPITLPASATVMDAIRTLDATRISSVLIERDGAVAGIVTERDLITEFARKGPDGATTQLAAIMSAPVDSLPGDAFVYRALGRMGRRGFRHLGVHDAAGKIVGVVTARRLLKRRVGEGLALGDAIDVAESAAGLRAARNELPALAIGMLDEGLDALEVASVISAELRAITARAGVLAERALAAERGPAPSRWCLLVLGSGGRGESLLSADQDNALIHDGGDDSWFAALGQRIADALNEAGIPYCKGGIMASNAQWRGDLAAWRARIAHWMRHPEGEQLLDVDIFYDFAPVHGALDLADALRAEALEAAQHAPLLLRLLTRELARLSPPLTLLGGLRTDNNRTDLKLGGTMIVTAAARILALRHGVAATHTADRLHAASEPAKLAPDDLDRLLSAHATIMAAILRQQVHDIASGVAPSARVDPNRLARADRRRLVDALKSLRLAPAMLGETGV